MKRLFVLLGIAGVTALFPGASSAKEETIRVGYFPNITHSQAVIGTANGEFRKKMGPDVRAPPNPWYPACLAKGPDIIPESHSPPPQLPSKAISCASIYC